MVFSGKCILKTHSKFAGEHPCQSAISIKLRSKFIEITLRHGFSFVSLLHILRTPFYKNTSGCLLLISSCIDLLLLVHQIFSPLFYIALIYDNQTSTYRQHGLQKVSRSYLFPFLSFHMN